MGQSPRVRGAAPGESRMCVQCMCLCAGTSAVSTRPAREIQVPERLKVSEGPKNERVGSRRSDWRSQDSASQLQVCP